MNQRLIGDYCLLKIDLSNWENVESLLITLMRRRNKLGSQTLGSRYGEGIIAAVIADAKFHNPDVVVTVRSFKQLQKHLFD
jgi:hypothetical protein